MNVFARVITRLSLSTLVEIILGSLSSYIRLYVFIEQESDLLVLKLNDTKQN